MHSSFLCAMGKISQVRFPTMSLWMMLILTCVGMQESEASTNHVGEFIELWGSTNSELDHLK